MHWNSDDSAVSPVIGVILMVAITVVLAAVVFALTSTAGNESETPRFPIIKVTTGSAPTDGVDAQLFTVEHRAGKCLNMAEYTFKARLDDVVHNLVTSGYSAGPLCVGQSFQIGEPAAGAFGAADAGRHITLFALDGSRDAVVFEDLVRLSP